MGRYTYFEFWDKFPLIAAWTWIMLVQFIFYAWVKRKTNMKTAVALATIGTFVFQDILYNAIVGTILFREWPREWFFTTRLKRYANQPEAQRFKAVLNELDPGHV